VPAAVIITEPFALKTRLEAESFGVGWLPLIALPHPVGFLEPERAHEVFGASFDEVLFAITGAADEVQRRYTRKPGG
jgi:hypothetical protein